VFLIDGGIMEKEDKFCTPEQSEELFKLGVVIETEMYWASSKVLNHNELCHKGRKQELASIWYDIISRKIVFTNWEFFPAPDVAELGDFLWKSGYFLVPCLGGWDLYDHGGVMMYMQHFHKTEYTVNNEAQARCTSCIWLVKNKIIRLGDICQEYKESK
jgi:hypothetical protein